MKRTTISVTEEAIKQISKYGKYGDTPNSVILKIFREYEQLKKYKQTQQLKQHKHKTKQQSEK